MYSINEVVEILGISMSTIRAHMRRGLLTGAKKSGVWFFTDDDIKNYRINKFEYEHNKKEYCNEASKEGLKEKMSKSANMTDEDFYEALYILVFGEDEDEIHIDNVKNMFESLTDREQLILTLRVKNGLNLRETAEYMCLSSQRTGQIEAKALRKLRGRRKKHILTLQDALKEIERLKIKNDEMEVRLMESRQTLQNIGVNVEIPSLDCLDMRIEDVFDDISIRTYNCLCRAGKYKIKDILLLEADGLMNVRNLGRKSCEEIVSKMRKVGFHEWADKIEHGKETSS